MSSAFAADNQQIFAPNYLATSSETANGKELVWGPTLKSVQPITFNHEALRASAMSSSKSARARPQTVESAVINPESEMPRARPEVSSVVSFVAGFSTYSTTFDHVERHGNGNYSWFGHVDGSEFLSHFAVVDGSIAGEIWLPASTPGGFHYSLISRAGQRFLVQWNEVEVGRLLANDQKSSAPGSTMPMEMMTITIPVCAVAMKSFPLPPEREPYEQVNLLYVYDTTSVTWFGNYARETDPVAVEADLRAFLRASADHINLTLQNSKPGADYRVNLVRIEKVNYTSAGRLGDDITWAINSPEVAALRAFYGADSVGLWVGPPNPDWGGLAVGFNGGGLTPQFDGFHVNYVGGGGEVAAHEFGHIIGMQHQPEEPTVDPHPFFPFAYGHFVNGIFRDAMSYFIYALCPDSCPVVPIYSNPSVLVGGVPTGIPDKRENWRAITPAFLVVSQYHNRNECSEK
jgi:hypothetical protein